MPMTVSPSKKYLYAVIRSQPTRVLTYAIDPATGALTQKASAPLPDSMPYVSTDHTGRYLFTASYGGEVLIQGLSVIQLTDGPNKGGVAPGSTRSDGSVKVDNENPPAFGVGLKRASWRELVN